MGKKYGKGKKVHDTRKQVIKSQRSTLHTKRHKLGKSWGERKVEKNLGQNQPPNPVRYLKFPKIEKCGEIGNKNPTRYVRQGGTDASEPSQ